MDGKGDSTMLNDPQVVSDYERDGVVRIRQLFGAEQMRRIHEAMDHYLGHIVPGLSEGDVIFEPDGKSVRNLFRMEEHYAFFRSLSEDADLLRLLTQLVHGTPHLHGVETFNKPPQVGTGVPPHQDNAYFCQTPPDMLTVWIAIDPVTEQNGPVTYVRGSHRNGMRPHKPSGVKGNSMGLAEPFDKSDLLVGTLDPGDALIHHCQTIHYSAPNKTDKPRCGLLMVFSGEHTQVDPALKQAYEQARPTT